jgi:chemotaxis protein CheD
MNERVVRISDYAIGLEEDCLVTLGLGSCVAIAIHDRRARIGALAHCLLPDDTHLRERSNPARVPGRIVPVILDELRGRGAAGALTAKLVGGAAMFRSLIDKPGMNVGERNIQAARDALAVAGIRLIAEDVGGESGRSLKFTPGNGAIMVRTIGGGEHVF